MSKIVCAPWIDKFRVVMQCEMLFKHVLFYHVKKLLGLRNTSILDTESNEKDLPCMLWSR